MTPSSVLGIHCNDTNVMSYLFWNVGWWNLSPGKERLFFLLLLDIGVFLGVEPPMAPCINDVIFSDAIMTSSDTRHNPAYWSLTWVYTTVFFQTFIKETRKRDCFHHACSCVTPPPTLLRWSLRCTVWSALVFDQRIADYSSGRWMHGI